MTSNDKTLKLSPWNENNYLITENDIYTIYEKCGFENVRETIKINDLKLYQTAFIHGSYIKKKHSRTLIHRQKINSDGRRSWQCKFRPGFASQFVEAGSRRPVQKIEIHAIFDNVSR